MKCPKCKYLNDPSALTCNLCGEILPVENAEKPPPAEFHIREGATIREKLARTEVEIEAPQKPAEAEPEINLDLILPAFPDSDELNYCLVCEPLDPVPLHKDTALTFGRDRTNDFIFPVGVVSRRHAEIFWEGESFVLRDLNSANGTQVNHIRIKQQALKDGDSIEMGPYELRFRAYKGSVEKIRPGLDEKRTTRKYTKTDLFKRSTTFAGKIGDVKMDEIVQLIDFNKKSGTLEIESGERLGVFFFRGGQILHGEYHNTKGMIALSRILQLKSGTFHFHTDLPDIDQTIFEPTSKVLLNAIRRLDEIDR